MSIEIAAKKTWFLAGNETRNLMLGSSEPHTSPARGVLAKLGVENEVSKGQNIKLKRSPTILRGRNNIRPDITTDLSRRLEQNPYDAIQNPKGIIDLGSAVNELMLDDLSGWTSRNVKKSQLKDTLGYGDTQGFPTLPKAAAEFMNEHFRVRLPLSSDNMLVANGVSTLLDALTYSITDEGDTILVPTPSYGMLAHDVWTRNGVHVVEVPCDDIPEERFWALHHRMTAHSDPRTSQAPRGRDRGRAES
ncbi:aminotransferase class I and II [Colletotrichum tofieldiae]|nr:aminotransferase class I and II [Colletotrichum tofieldiae]